MPAPQGVPKVALTTVYEQKHLSDAKTLSQPVLFKVPECSVQGAPWALFVGRTTGERHHWGQVPSVWTSAVT